MLVKDYFSCYMRFGRFLFMMVMMGEFVFFAVA